MKSIIALLTMLFSASLANAAVRHSVSWTVVANDGTIMIPRGKFTAFGRIVPEKLFRIDEDAIGSKKGRIAIPKSRLMIPIDGDSTKVCELLEHLGSSFDCLTDTNGDGAFDTFFGTQVFNSFMIGSIGDDGGFEPLVKPVLASAVDPLTETPLIELGIRYLGLSKNQIKFELCVRLAPSASHGIKYNNNELCQRSMSIPVVESKSILIIYGMRLPLTVFDKDSAILSLQGQGNIGRMTTSNSFPF